MKIDDILTEGVTPESIIEKIRQAILSHGHESFKECMSANMFFEHNSHAIHSTRIVKNIENRRPSDTPPKVHKMLDTAMEERFGKRMRSNALFSWPLSGDVPIKSPHMTNIAFPVGEYTVVRSRFIRDFYVFFNTDMFINYINSDNLKDCIKAFSNKVDDYDIVGLTEAVESFPADSFVEFSESRQEFGETIRRVYPDMKTNEVSDLFWGIVDAFYQYCEQHLPLFVEKNYERVSDLRTLSGANRNEIMIHAEAFVLVNLSELLTAYQQLSEEPATLNNLFEFVMNFGK